MKVKVDGIEYNFKFTYDAPVTTCSVDGIIRGSALCNKRDNFCRATGRKLAFSRALLVLGMDKRQRRMAWQRYFEAMPIKRQVSLVVLEMIESSDATVSA